MVPPESSSIAAQSPAAARSSDFPGIQTSGSCCRPDAAASANGQTASACCAGLSAAASVGSGTLKTMSGLKYTLSIKNGGFMLMHAKRLGISPDFTQRVFPPFLSLLVLLSSVIWQELTSVGWGRKLSYCIAFSIDGATDVTRRYVRSPWRHAAPRKRVSEEVLLWVIFEIRRKRRENLSRTELKRLLKEDEREERELRAYTAAALAAEINSLLPSGQARSRSSDEQKTPSARQNASTGWLSTRQTDSGHSGPDRSPSNDR